MNLSATELARRTDDSSVFRHDAVRLSLVIGPLVSKDGHELTVRGELSVRLVERDADIELFKEQLLATDASVTVDTIRQRLLPALETTLRTFAAQHDAEAAIGQRAMVSHLTLERANEFGFACGLEFIPPADVSIACPSLDAKRAAERVQRDQIDHLDRAAQVLQHTRSLGTTDGLRPDEQATLLQLLLRATPAQKSLIAAGANLIELNPATGETRVLETPKEIGPLRCVGHSGQLLVGGQHGVAISSPLPCNHGRGLGWGSSSSANVQALPPTLACEYSGEGAVFLHGQSTERGINSVAIDSVSGTIVAAHSEFGLLRWSIEDRQPLPSLPTDAPARFLAAIDERILFAAGDRVMLLAGDAVQPVHQADGQILAIEVSVDSVWIVRENGVVERLSRSDLSVRGSFRRSTRLQAAALIEVQGMTAIALAGESGPVDIVSTSGAPMLELHSPQMGLRMLCACGPQVVGISADRQTAVIWEIDKPANPARSVNLVARHGHRAVDICCAPL